MELTAVLEMKASVQFCQLECKCCPFQLKELFEEGENWMTCCDNANYLKELLVKVNQAYDAFSSLSAHLSGNDIISSDLGTKLDVDTGYWGFKQLVQEWFDGLPPSSPVVSETTTTLAQVGDEIGSSLPLNWIF